MEGGSTTELSHIKALISAVLLCFGPPAHQQADSPSTLSRPDPLPPAQSQPAQVPGQSNTQLYILMYHDVVEDGTEAGCGVWTITSSRLREDFQWLSGHGYTTLLPSEVVQKAREGALPERAVLVTFDDGYASNLELALPILEETHTKAVVSVITERLDSERPGFMTWDMCKELEASPLVEIGSHTHTLHGTGEGIKRLKGESEETYRARVLPDIQTSIGLIEEHLGAKPRFLAYPHGAVDPWAEDFLRENFDMTVTTAHGLADISGGLYNLNRHNITVDNPVRKYLPE